MNKSPEFIWLDFTSLNKTQKVRLGTGGEHMNKSALKQFATAAREQLMTAVNQRAYQLGITKETIKEPELFEDGFRINGHFFPKHERQQRDLLVNKINQTSFEHVIDEVAYMWFNRLIAIRFMEV